MTCPNCGATVAENRRFCGKCGTDLAPEAAAPPAYGEPVGTTPPPPAAPTAWGAGVSGAVVPPPGPAAAPPGAADPFAPPDLGYPPPAGYGAPPPGAYPPPPPQYPPPGYPGGAPGWGGYGYGPPHTNGLAIVSLVLGIVGWTMCGIGSVVAVVLGYVSRAQIKQSWGRQTGSGMATAGIVLGFIGLAFWLAIFVSGLFGNSS